MSISAKMHSQLQTNNLGNKQKVIAFFRRNWEMIATVLSGLFIVGGWLASTTEWQSIAVVCFIAAFIIGGYAKAKEGIEELFEHRQLNVNMLMIFAAVGSAAIGYWTEGAILIFIFALSGALETYTMDRSRREVLSLMALQPHEARLFVDGDEQRVPVEQLQVGQTVIVKPGDRIPVDGTVSEGMTSVDQAAITGESIPVEKRVGDQVLSGTVNQDGAILVTVDKQSDETLFQKMVQLVQKAQAEKPPQQAFIEKFEQQYVKVVLLAVAMVMVGFPLLLNWSWAEAVYRGMVLLVVASPCALVASIMPALLSAISNGARKGVLFKSGSHLQHLKNVRVVAFDKTGTLTKGTLEVKDVLAFGSVSERDILQAAASVEQFSTHPLAEAIVNYARQQSVELLPVHEMGSETGYGVHALVNDVKWKVGKREWMDESLSETIDKQVQALAVQGKTIVYVQRGDEVVGLIALQDVIRNDVKQVVTQLKKWGIHTVMLTGDSKQTAHAVALQAGLDDYYANCLPGRKVELLREMQEKFGPVIMIGDGVNDAPALATASVGVGMGAGTDVALETSDVVLVNNELNKLALIMKLAKRAGSIIKWNIGFSVAVIVVLIAANFFQSINLPIGVIGHEGSTILVILNGLRLLFVK